MLFPVIEFCIENSLLGNIHFGVGQFSICDCDLAPKQTHLKQNPFVCLRDVSTLKRRLP